jgi:hypothetical protein
MKKLLIALFSGLTVNPTNPPANRRGLRMK